MVRLFLALMFIMLCFLPLQGGFIAPAAAITAEEQLADPELEARARGLSRQLRCLVCQNQSIDDSDADLAKDLRAEVRKKLQGGAEDAAILADLKNRYGDYVLLKPPVNLATTLLWATPILALILGAGLILATRRKIATGPLQAAPQIASQNRTSPTDAPFSLGKARRTDSQSSRQSRLILSIAGGVCVLGAAAIYLFALGNPSMPAQPLSARTAELNQSSAAAEAQLATRQQTFAIAREKTTSQPEEIGNWLALALAAAELGRTEQELDALRAALRLSGGDISVKSMLAEALTRSVDNQVIPEARQLVAEILQANPEEPRALFLSGLAAMEDGEYEVALAAWGYLVEISPPQAPWLEMVLDNMRDAAKRADIAEESLPALSAETLSQAAEMSEEDRMQMIEGMVEALRQRLQDAPEDPLGWQRLARAYEVLDQPEAALKALVTASRLAATDLSVQLAVLEKLMNAGQDTGLSAPLMAQAESVLAQAENIDADDPEVLFFAGHFARLAGDIGMAREQWQKLLDRLPPESETARLLQTMLDELAR
jgi:cytochrome c-type biogenesis protein CcmH